ncbi:Ycf48-like protein [Emticicia aquatica]|uniref:Ycf48-like protein n=1 Tax=Emticicia aquatica TaxID=1681835 RepID=A0ABN8ESB0_9BACT|nr:YCF48-related protein [Emticicia aquatica]CAH0994775.1 Ycf48-like protein [Emticicia aquatica]
MIRYIFKKKACLLLIFVGINTVDAQWKKQNSGTDASFRSIHAINKKVVWAGGSKGTVLRTTDAGKTWQVIKVKDAEKLDFRDIYGVSEKIAFIMSAGNAEDGAAKIFKTIDGGISWKVMLNYTQKGIFFDSMDFWNENEGIIIGDPIDDKPFIIRTLDGGNSWNRIDKAKLPNVLEGEASFAASGSCVAIQPNGKAWINTQSRVFFTPDKGETWEVYQTPFKKGQTSGIFGLHFWNENQGIAVGGDYKNDKEKTNNIAITNDAGKTWTFLATAQPDGLKEGAWYLPNKKMLLVGTSGTSLSEKENTAWRAIDNESFHAVSCFKNACWAIGGKGNLAKWGN